MQRNSSRPGGLEEAARAAGLRDQSVLELANDALPVFAQVRDLQQRFPGAFDVRDLPARDYAESKRGLLQANAQRDWDRR